MTAWIDHFLFGLYPYIALAICLIGSWARFDLSQYSWKAGSSQIFNRTPAEIGRASCRERVSSPV